MIGAVFLETLKQNLEADAVLGPGFVEHGLAGSSDGTAF